MQNASHTQRQHSKTKKKKYEDNINFSRGNITIIDETIKQLTSPPKNEQNIGEMNIG